METYILVATLCGEMGSVGLVIQDRLNAGNFAPGDVFVMFDEVGVAHDLTEHPNGIEAIGTVFDEFQALGAIWYTRAQFSDSRRDDTGSAIPMYGHMAGDIVRMASIAYHDGMHGTLYDEPEETNFEEDFEDVMVEARKNIPVEWEDRLDDFDIDEYLKQALWGMRLGVAKQEALYPKATDANNRFWNIADAVKSILPKKKHPWSEPVGELYEGQEFELVINDEGRVFIGEYYEFDDEDELEEA